MSFSTRLWLGYFVFVALILFMSITVIVSFRDLGSAIDIIMRENYASSEAASSMIDALSIIDASMLAHILGQGEMQARSLQDAKDQFDSAFNMASSNVTIPGEKELLAQVEQYYAFLENNEKELKTQETNRMQFYQTSVLPVQAELKRLLVEIIQMNQEAMARADKNAKILASNGAAWVSIITVIGLIMALAMGRSMTRSLITPLKTLTNVTRRIAEGDLSRRVPLSGKDEIGTLSESINFLAEFLDKNLATEQARLLGARQLAQSLIDTIAPPTLIIDGNKTIALMNHNAEPLFAEAAGIDFRKKLLEILSNNRVGHLGTLERREGETFLIRAEALMNGPDHSIGRIVYCESARNETVEKPPLIRNDEAHEKE